MLYEKGYFAHLEADGDDVDVDVLLVQSAELPVANMQGGRSKGS